jgi:hypothetical protein
VPSSCSQHAALLCCKRAQTNTEQELLHACRVGGTQHSWRTTKPNRGLPCCVLCRRQPVPYVATPEELQAALSAGARHIEITEHLDLTTFETFNSEYGLVKVEVSASTWSIRVCSISSCPVIGTAIWCVHLFAIMTSRKKNLYPF